MVNQVPQQSSWIRRFLAPPQFADEDKTRIARMLNMIIIVLFVVVALYGLVSAALGGDVPSLILSAITLLFMAGIRILMLRGHVQLAGALLALVLLVNVAVGVYITGSIRAPITAAFLLSIIIAGLLVSTRAAIGMLALTMLTLVVLLQAELNGQLPAYSPSVGPIQLATYLGTFTIVVVLLGLATRGTKESIDRARSSRQALTQSNRELEAIRNSLEQRVNERTSQLNVSAEVARAASSILDQNELIAQVTRLIVERFQLYYVATFLVDQDAKFAVLSEATGEAGRLLKEQGHKLEIAGPSMVGTAIATRRPRIAQDVDQETIRYANPLLTETRSEIALPLVVGDHVIGALDVQATQVGIFDESSVTVLQGLADQIAIAINTARQYQAAQLEARQATALFEASRLAGYMNEPLDSIATKLLQAVSGEAQFDSWLAVTYDDKENTETIVALHDPDNPGLSPTDQPTKLDPRSTSPLAVAIRTREPVLIADPENDLRLANLPPNVRRTMHIICVPAMLGNRILGALTLGRASGDTRITQRELQLGQAVAAQFAVAIENRRLLEQSQKSVEELNRLMHLYMHEGWASFSADRSAAELKQEFSRPVEPPLMPATDQVAQISQDITSAEIKPASVDGQSVIHVPIELRGEVFGALSIQDNVQREWTEDELATVKAVADQVAQSVEAARLLEESETSLQETSTLYRASRAIASAQTPREIIHAVGDNVAPQIDRCLLLMIDPYGPSAERIIEVAAAWERSVDEPALIGTRWAASQIPLIGPYSTEPLMIADVANAPEFELDPEARDYYLHTIGARAITIVRLLSASRTLGWLMIASQRGPYQFSNQELRRYRTLAGQAAVALENRRLFQDVQDRVNELTILTRIGRRLAATLDLDEVLALVVDETLNATRAAQASLSLYNEAEKALEVRVMRGYPAEVEQEVVGTLIRPGEGLHGQVLNTGEAILVDDVQREANYRKVSDTARSEYIIPIKQGNLLVGALNLESPIVNAFGETDIRLLEAMADQVAVAIANARAYEAERQAVERMREVDRLKTQFLANMSHELRTPLNSIIGFSRVMLRGIDGALTDMQQTDLTSIYNSGQHLLSLINNILDLSKIEAGKMELSIEPVNLQDIAKSVMSTAIALVKDKPIKLDQDVPADLPAVMADQTRVRQIILNLVSNAAKFTDKGSITLRMVAAPREVLISVTDTGIGIPPDKIEHIFEEFTQVDASTTRRYGGTGLGLAITRKFVEMHHGRIWAESHVGVGSVFTFTLPREQLDLEPVIGLPTDLEARGEGKKLVMCVDDDPGVITLYKRYLEKQGYQVIGVTDPLRAVEEAKRLLPYAITLDVLMPNRDGWDVLADLKKTPEISATPILVCSIIQDKTRGFSLGAADYLVKPITEDELLRALDRVNHARNIHKVLVMDDEPAAVQLIKRILAAQPGLKVLDAPSGVQGLAILQSDKPDLVILDLMMPDIDGFSVLESMKSSPATQNTPVIIVTAKDITAEDRARLNGKALALFNKGTFTADQLLEDISNALNAMNGQIVREGKKVEVFAATV